MTVKELTEILSKLDPNKEVLLWNAEWDCKDPFDVEVDKDGDVVFM